MIGRPNGDSVLTRGAGISLGARNHVPVVIDGVLDHGTAAVVRIRSAHDPGAALALVAGADDMMIEFTKRPCVCKQTQ